jgi:hypothetical protein
MATVRLQNMVRKRGCISKGSGRNIASARQKIDNSRSSGCCDEP